MEQVRTRENSSGPHPTESPGAPLTHEDSSLLTASRTEFDAEYPTQPSPPPSTTNFQRIENSHLLRLELPRSKPLFRGFERPSFSRIATLTALCLFVYPAFYLLTFVAKDRSLFIVRLVVSAWCSAAGFALGYILLKTGAQHIEAASEFTLVRHKDPLRLYFK